MSTAMNMPGAPASGMQQNGAPGGADPLAASRSLTNPTDLAGMTTGVNPEQTVAEGFQQALGIDVNTTTMAEFQQLIQERMDPDPNKKAARMAAQPPMGGPGGAPPGGPPGGAPPTQDLEGLMSRLG